MLVRFILLSLKQDFRYCYLISGAVGKKLLDFTSYFQEYFCNYSCIVLTETWLTADFGELFQICSFKNYDLYRSQNGGGIRIYVKNNVDIKILTDNTFVTNLYEMLSVQVMSAESKFIVCYLSSSHC